MANKIITIGSYSSEDSSLPSRPIFVDIGTTASPNVQNKESDWKISRTEDLNAVKNSLHQIFSWIPGERILNPEFGSNLRKLLYEGITDFNVEQIMAEIRHCVTEWEPRVQIQKVVNASGIDDTEDNTVRIEVVYTVPGLTGNQLYAEPLTYTPHN